VLVPGHQNLNCVLLPESSRALQQGARPLGLPCDAAPSVLQCNAELRHASRVRARIVECAERASEPNCSDEERRQLLSFLCVGAGPTGVEFCAELSDLISQDLKLAFPALAPFFRVTLIEASDKVLGTFAPALARYALKRLRSRDVTVRTNTRIARVEPGYVELSDGERIPFGLCVWSTGVAPRTLVRSLPFSLTKRGRIIIDEYLRVRDYKQGNIFAVGDAAENLDEPAPTVAQVANQQARWLARYLNALAADKTAKTAVSKPFHFRDLGRLAYVGGNRAVSDLPVGQLQGIWAWLFWRSAYMTNLVSLRNKILVPMTWFKTFFFGRDVSSFD